MSPKTLPRKYHVIRTHSSVTTLLSWNQCLKHASEQSIVSGLSWEQDGLHPNTISMEEEVPVWTRVLHSFPNWIHEFQSVMGCRIGPGYVQVAWIYCDLHTWPECPMLMAHHKSEGWDYTTFTVFWEANKESQKPFPHLCVRQHIPVCMFPMLDHMCSSGELRDLANPETVQVHRLFRWVLGLHSAAILSQPGV